MMLKRLVPSAVCIAFLAACASSDPGAAARPGASSAAALSEADAASKAGQHERALAILKGAASAFPADKAPWLRMAQMRLDSNHHGEAIVAGLEALKRDPGDLGAHSIVALSAMRVSTRALAELEQKNQLSGTVRGEAHDLSRLLRASLGDDPLQTAKNAGRTATKAHKAPASAVAPAKPKPAASGDPFGALGALR